MKLFIANRGEIALRIIRTCRRLGIETVIAYSDADRGSLPLRFADERLALGGSTPVDTYLNIPKLIRAALQTKCDALHPGYGFLSEDPNLVKACEENGIIFVGPPSRTLTRLGNKLQARSLMENCGVPVIPGSEGNVTSEEEAASVAKRIGFPVIIKAVYGGGGRGMRVATNSDEVRRFFRITRLEAGTAFGRTEIYMERRLRNPRHIEIQVLADAKGKAVSLGERECSIQRRHQKIVEEAPSVGIDDVMRKKLNDAALNGLRTAEYLGAGTVEFLVEGDGAFYFLEVNKRLQVEHLVTELTTDIDIVEEQLKIASGERLGISQSEVAVTGSAINCRINAEDPREGFVPTPGTVLLYHPPTGPGVRIDSALFSGCVIPEYYDSLIAKLSTWARSRKESIARMRVALDEIEIVGVPTTVPLHRTLMADPDFESGNFDTTFLDQFMPRLNSMIAKYERIAAMIAALENSRRPKQHYANGRIDGSRWRTAARTQAVTR